MLALLLPGTPLGYAVHDGVLKLGGGWCRYELEDLPLLVLEAATCVTSLSLDSNDLAALPPDIAAFTCLVELLSVCDNRLQALPRGCTLPRQPYIASMPCRTALCVRARRLSCVGN